MVEQQRAASGAVDSLVQKIDTAINQDRNDAVKSGGEKNEKNEEMTKKEEQQAAAIINAKNSEADRKSKKKRGSNNSGGSGGGGGQARVNFYDEKLKMNRHYNLIKAIGQGSYGKVFLAETPDDQKKFALKRMNFHQIDAKEINLEINVLKDCKHPNIVEFISNFRDSKYFYIVMEYCDGNSLLTLLKLTKSMPERTIAYVVRECTEGLKYLHHSRKIHRDMKCANILTTSDGYIKLADFGVSAKITDTIAKRDSLIGTPYWIAPEVCNPNMTYSYSCDIWSLGICCFEMTSGEPPHYSKLPLEAINLIGKPGYKPPSIKDDQWSPLFQRFVKFILVVNPNRRPTADQVLNHEFLNASDLGRQLMKEYFEYCDSVKKNLPDYLKKGSRNTKKATETKGSGDINNFYSQEYRKLYDKSSCPGNIGNVVKVKSIDIINTQIITNFFGKMINKELSFALGNKEQLINKSVSILSQDMAALLRQVAKGIPMTTVNSSVSFVHPGSHDQYLIIGGDAGIFITKISNDDAIFHKFHPKICHKLIIYENTLLSISGNNRRVFEHNLLLVTNEINDDNYKASTMKSLALKINAKLTDLNFPQKMAIKVKATSYSLPDLTQIYDMCICKFTKDPIVVLYNDSYIIVMLWHNIKKRFIIARKFEAPFHIPHPVFHILIPPWAKSPQLCLNIFKKSANNSIEFCFLDISSSYINKNFLMYLKTNKEYEQLEISHLMQINLYSFAIVDKDLPNTICLFDFHGIPLKNISDSLAISKPLPTSWIYPFTHSEILIDDDVQSLFIFDDKICIFDKTSFVAYSLFSGKKTQYFTDPQKEYKLLFVDRYAVVVASDTRGCSRLFDDPKKSTFSSDSKNSAQVSRDDASEDNNLPSNEVSHANNPIPVDAYNESITISFLIGL